MMTRLQYGRENPVVMRLVHAGNGPSGKNLRDEHNKMLSAAASSKRD